MQIIIVKNIDEGIERAKEELYKRVDGKTVLFLSGGNTPKPLYELLAKEEIIKPAAVGMVDERFGETHSTNSGQALREKSNERMCKNTGLLRYFEYIGIPWYPILQNQNPRTKNREQIKDNTVILRHQSSTLRLRPEGPKNPLKTEQEILRYAQDDNLSLKNTAVLYDRKLRELFFHFPKSVAVLGIGADGHTAGIPAQKNIILEGVQRSIGSRQKQEDAIASLQHDDLWNTHNLVTSYNDTSGNYGQRITMTFTALSMLDHLVILALGKGKKKALEKMFTSGSLEEIPARFYNKEEISKKTILITDQTV